MIEIRQERPQEAIAIRDVVEQAFGRSAETNLVEMLRQANKAPISLVAISDE